MKLLGTCKRAMLALEALPKRPPLSLRRVESGCFPKVENLLGDRTVGPEPPGASSAWARHSGPAKRLPVPNEAPSRVRSLIGVPSRVMVGK